MFSLMESSDRAGTVYEQVACAQLSISFGL